MRRWMIPIVVLLLGVVALPVVAQEESLPDDLEPTVVDFGGAPGDDPAIIVVDDWFREGYAVAFATETGVTVGIVSEDGFEDWGADLPVGTPTAFVPLLEDDAALLAITTRGPTARLFLLGYDGSVQPLATKAMHLTTDGGWQRDNTVAFPLISADGSYDTRWSFDGNTRQVDEIQVVAPVPDVHDIAHEEIIDGGALFKLYGAAETRTLAPVGPSDSDPVPIPGVPVTIFTTRDDPGNAVVGSLGVVAGTGELHLYRYERAPGRTVELDPTFADPPQVVYGEVSGRDASIVLLRHTTNLLTAATTSDLVPALDLLDRDGNHLDSRLLDVEMRVDDLDVDTLGKVMVVGSRVDDSGYRSAIFSLSGRFFDDDDSVHEDNIEAIAERGIAFGCNPPDNTLFCPYEPVTRGQMAAFLARALELTAAGDNPFEDTTNSVFVDDITAIAEAGITLGCNPPDNTHYCPKGSVLRGEMAAFLARAFDLTATGDNPFEDTADSVFVDDITAIAEAGITLGCNPPDNTLYCPRGVVTRGQMASFLIRALGP